MVHLSGVVGTLAVLPAVAAALSYRRLPLAVTCTLAQIAISGFAVSVAATQWLAPHTTGLLGKDARGHLQWWGIALMWPYHLGLQSKLWFQRQVSVEPVYNKITDGWYLGSWPLSKAALPPGDPAVLDVTCELPRRHDHVPYELIPCWDTWAPSAVQIQQGVQWLQRQRKLGRPVYVHCAHGHGRSTTVLVAALTTEGWASNFIEAFDKVKQIRPKVKLNPRAMAALVAWERQQQRAKSQ